MAVPNRKRAPRQLTIKVLVLGERSVGKSATIVRFLTHRFIGHYNSAKDWTYKQPIAYDAKKNMTTSVELLELLQTNNTAADQLEVKVHWADAFIVLYAINDRNSFDRAKHFLNSINNNNNQQTADHNSTAIKSAANQHHQHQIKRPILLLANKLDLSRDGRQVLPFEGQSLAALHQCLFSEISAAQSHIGICNTFKALLVQANSLPAASSSSCTIDTNTDHQSSSSVVVDNSNSSVKISTKLNNNLHDRYDSIKSSFRRASLAIVSSKTFVNHNKKSSSPALHQHHHGIKTANSEWSNSSINGGGGGGDNNHTTRNRFEIRCRSSIGAIEDGLDNNNKSTNRQLATTTTTTAGQLRNSNKRRGLFRYKHRRTTITVTSHLSDDTNTIDGLVSTNSSNTNKKQLVRVVANPSEHMATTMDVMPISAKVKRYKSYSLKTFTNRHTNDGRLHNNLITIKNQQTLDGCCDDRASSGLETQSSLDRSSSSGGGSSSSKQNDLSDSNCLTSDSNLSTTNERRSLSRGSCSSFKSIDTTGTGNNKRNVTKLLNIMFNRPSSVIGSSTVATSQQLSTTSPIHCKSTIPLYREDDYDHDSQIDDKKHSQPLHHELHHHNGADYRLDLYNNDDDQHRSMLNAGPHYPLAHQSALNKDTFHQPHNTSQVSCARQLNPILDRRNRRWYRLIGH